MSNALRLSVQEYEQMVERGAFDALHRRVELVQGEIRTTNPAGPAHDDIIDFLTHWSVQNTDPTLTRVRVQTGLNIPAFDSRTEPDVMWVRKGDYRHRHPEPIDVQLLIEVADSSLENDRKTKAELYAKSGIYEYWIVNVVESVVHVFLNPSPLGYQSMQTLRSGDTVAPQARAQCILDVASLFANG
jgi:Uma2 family endonuclease